MPQLFTGFSAKSFRFLHGLQKHNTREWFEPHKPDYQQFILQPLQALVEDLAPLMVGIDSKFEVTPAVSKTISRIYRDTRFSKDKVPYKTNHWITFKRPSKEWQNHPAYFFELSPESYRFGMGFYCADRVTMDRFRADLDRNPKSFLSAIRFFNEGQFELAGENYKRPLKPDIPSELRDWYNSKSPYLVRSFAVEKDGIPASFAGDLADSFVKMAPLYQYFSNVVQPEPVKVLRKTLLS
ncbi:MAG: DUF2461 domain-containing protein [Chlorobiales bacterium]|nr:DUF2461 domain-containing protein [Chlorobiales bacterium]